MYENYTTLPLLCYSSRDSRPPAQELAVGKDKGIISRKVYIFQLCADQPTEYYVLSKPVSCIMKWKNHDYALLSSMAFCRGSSSLSFW